jgi:hypothetical protein
VEALKVVLSGEVQGFLLLFVTVLAGGSNLRPCISSVDDSYDHAWVQPRFGAAKVGYRQLIAQKAGGLL